MRADAAGCAKAELARATAQTGNNKFRRDGMLHTLSQEAALAGKMWECLPAQVGLMTTTRPLEGRQRFCRLDECRWNFCNYCRVVFTYSCVCASRRNGREVQNPLGRRMQRTPSRWVSAAHFWLILVERVRRARYRDRQKLHVLAKIRSNNRTIMY